MVNDYNLWTWPTDLARNRPSKVGVGHRPKGDRQEMTGARNEGATQVAGQGLEQELPAALEKRKRLPPVDGPDPGKVCLQLSAYHTAAWGLWEQPLSGRTWSGKQVPPVMSCVT